MLTQRGAHSSSSHVGTALHTRTHIDCSLSCSFNRATWAFSSST